LIIQILTALKEIKAMFNKSGVKETSDIRKAIVESAKIKKSDKPTDV
jgi:hypothetical protein